MKVKIKSFIQYLIVIIAFVAIYSLLKSISRLTSANQKIIDEQNYVSELKKQNEELNQKLSIVQNPLFIEEEARNKLGLAKKGEIVVVLPDATTLRNLVPKEFVEKVAFPDDNLQKWMKLFNI